MLNITNECDMMCSYCDIPDKSGLNSSDVLRMCEDVRTISEPFIVMFRGGEPTLAFDILKEVYDFIVTSSNMVRGFYLSTNLLNLDSELLMWLIDSHVDVIVSLDGNSYMNQLRVDTNRLGTHDRVVENIETLIYHIGVDRVTVKMTTHPYNVGYILDGVDHIYNIGVRNISVDIVNETITIGAEYAERYVQEMNKLSKILSDYEGLTISEFEMVHLDERTEYQEIKQKVYDIHNLRSESKLLIPLTIDDMVLTSTPKVEMDKSRSIADTLEWFNTHFPFECNVYTTVLSDTLYSTSVTLKENDVIKFNGKGVTEDASVVSALAEVIERLSGRQFPIPLYSFTENIDKVLEYASYSDMEEYVGDDKVSLPHHSKMVDRIPTRHVKAYDLSNIRNVGINIQLATLEQGSNGLASGNTYEEAIVQATCEVFERFCLYHSTVEKVSLCPTIKPETIESEVIQSHLKFFYENNYSVYIKDIGFGLFPVMGVLFENNNKPETDPTRFSYICAGSFNSDTAIIRCFTEKAQIGINYQGVSLSDSDMLADLADGGRTKYDLTHLRSGKPIDYKRVVSDDALSDIYEIKTICCELGVDFYVVDFNRYDFPVVYVIIPEVSNMDRWYGDNNTIKMIDEASQFNFLLKESV